MITTLNVRDIEPLSAMEMAAMANDALVKVANHIRCNHADDHELNDAVSVLLFLEGASTGKFLKEMPLKLTVPKGNTWYRPAKKGKAP
jgi:hypothetical protein